MIRLATPADADAFHELAMAYIAESGQNRSYSPTRTQQTFEAMLVCPETALIVSDGSQGGLAGAVIITVDYAFTEKPTGILSYLYVREPYRGTPLARALLDAACKFADNSECTHLWVGANGMLPGNATQQFVNLCRKFGFHACGQSLCRSRSWAEQ